jgi:PKD repeat protein
LGAGRTRKNKIQIIILSLILIIFTSLISITIVTAQPPTIVKGYIYIDGIITAPEEVHLTFPDQARIGTIYDDGRYIIVFTGEEPGTTGEFYIIYSGKTYVPPETVTLEEEVYVYNIDLHIKISGEQQPPEEPVDPTNMQPKADANGPYYETVDEIVNFDGSYSYDSDGSISKYEWDFGDGSTDTGETPSYTYRDTGDYIVRLTVTDNKGKTDLDITYAYITEIPSSPPTKPIIIGPKSGNVKIEYNFTFISTDIENDTIYFYIDWGDNTDPKVSGSIQNGTNYTTSYSWTYPNIYTIQVYAVDERDVISQETKHLVLIDTIYCEDIGYMTDYTIDDIYDLFYSNETRLETPINFEDGIYLIDEDNDGIYDYQFNMTTLEVINYAESDTGEKTSSFFNLIAPFALYILIFIIILLFFGMGILILKIRKKTKKEKEKKTKKIEEKEKQVITETKVIEEEKKLIEEKIKDIESEIDALIARKKK